MSTPIPEAAGQCLTFKLGEEIFGIDVKKVREILEMIKITRVPQMPDFVQGVINLRGSVVPVIDMRLKFGMQDAVRTINSCIVVVEVEIDSEAAIFGALVDSVQEVVELESKDIEPAPRMGTYLKAEYIKGMGKHNDGFIIILEADKIFSVEELDDIRSSKQTENESIDLSII
jgi:purine-binding chemotaxis protein CheW